MTLDETVCQSRFDIFPGEKINRLARDRENDGCGFLLEVNKYFAKRFNIERKYTESGEVCQR